MEVISRTVLEIIFFFIFYSFLGWAVEVAIVAVKERRFRNRGFVNLPFCTMYGVMMVLLHILWLHLLGHPLFKFITTFVVFVTVQSFAEFITMIVRKAHFFRGGMDSTF